jgi:hypothetical protein
MEPSAPIPGPKRDHNFFLALLCLNSSFLAILQPNSVAAVVFLLMAPLLYYFARHRPPIHPRSYRIVFWSFAILLMLVFDYWWYRYFFV